MKLIISVIYLFFILSGCAVEGYKGKSKKIEYSKIDVSNSKLIPVNAATKYLHNVSEEALLIDTGLVFEKNFLCTFNDNSIVGKSSGSQAPIHYEFLEMAIVDNNYAGHAKYLKGNKKMVVLFDGKSEEHLCRIVTFESDAKMQKAIDALYSLGVKVR